MQDILNDDGYDETWLVVLHNKAEYRISKLQALVLKQAMNEGRRQVMFETFMIPINYIVEFYRVRRFKKGQYELTAKASEEEYKPIPKEKWEDIKKQIYNKLHRK